MNMDIYLHPTIFECSSKLEQLQKDTGLVAYGNTLQPKKPATRSMSRRALDRLQEVPINETPYPTGSGTA